MPAILSKGYGAARTLQYLFRMNWTRTSAATLITGYTVTLTNESGFTTRQVKFGIDDYLGAQTKLQGNRWTLNLFMGTVLIETRQNRYASEAAARTAARVWITTRLHHLRIQYKQAEQNVVADAIARGYKLEDKITA